MELKETIPTIADTPPLVNVLIRFIGSQVWNACVLYRLLLARQNPLLPRSATELPSYLQLYTKVRKRCSRQCTFKLFIRRVANALLNIPSRLQAPKDGAGVESQTLVSTVAPRFKRRVLQSINEAAMVELRQSHSNNPHICVTLMNRKYCALCSTTTTENGSPTRTGAQVKSFCETCRVPLCMRKRGNQRLTCWQLFHRATKLLPRPYLPQKRNASEIW